MSASRLARFAVATCVLLASVGCGPRGGAPTSGTPATPSLSTLAGVTWTLVSLGGQPLPQGTRPPTAIFDGARLAGFGGCNRYTGQVQDTGPGAITIGPVAATKMACPPPAMDVEGRYFTILSPVTQYRVAASRLVLSGPSGELVFERATP
jgi:heat shock protein HslJ